MNDSDIRQQMVARERFAPDAEEVHAVVLAGRAAPTSVSRETRRTRLLTAAAAGVVIVIAVAIGLTRFLQPAPQVSSPPPSTPSATSPLSKAAPAWVGIRWNLDTIAQGDIRIAVPADAGGVLQFGAGGQVTGEGRCYTSSGLWTSTGQTFRVKPIARREHSCPSVLDSSTPETMPNQKVIRDALQSLTTVGANEEQVGPQSLTLQSGPYKLIYLNAGPSMTNPSTPEATSTLPASPTSVSQLPTGRAQTSAEATEAGDHATPQRIVGASVYDPMGDGVKDNSDRAPLAVDGNQQTSWDTFSYQQQFPSELKPGVGLTVEFATAIAPTSVTVSSQTPRTIIEIRSATSPDLPYQGTVALARATIASGTPARPGTVEIPLAKAPRSKYLVVFVVHMGAVGSRFQSDINEITVMGH